jgi:hypothetical protein
MRLVTGVLALVMTVLIANTAEARRDNHHRSRHHVTTSNDHSIKYRRHVHDRRHVHVRRKHGGLKLHHARRVAGGGTHGRPSAWCGWWLGRHLGMGDRRLWLARNWAQVGRNIGRPQVGAVVVWRHHVGIITGRAGAQWIIKSGNDGRRVRERPRSIAGAIAFRRV